MPLFSKSANLRSNTKIQQQLENYVERRQYSLLKAPAVRKMQE